MAEESKVNEAATKAFEEAIGGDMAERPIVLARPEGEEVFCEWYPDAGGLASLYVLMREYGPDVAWEVKLGRTMTRHEFWDRPTGYVEWRDSAWRHDEEEQDPDAGRAGAGS